MYDIYYQTYGVLLIWVYFAILTLHLLLWTVTALCIRAGVLHAQPYMLILAALLPAAGPLLLVLIQCFFADKSEQSQELAVEKLRIEAEHFKNITVDDGMVASLTVPIEEALIVNTAKERRSIIMDVLNDDPKEYIEFLQKAGNNDDTEVVHYAVTAMVEISKENDYRMQELERRYRENPSDYGVLADYTHFLWSCLCSNMMQGQVEIVNRKLFSELIRQKLAIRRSFADYAALVKNELILKNYTLCAQVLDELETLFPEEEEYLLLRLQYYASTGQGEAIAELINRVEQSGKYLSLKAREVISFWKK